MCRGSEAGSYLSLIDFLYHSTLGLRVIEKKKSRAGLGGKAAVAANGSEDKSHVGIAGVTFHSQLHGTCPQNSSIHFPDSQAMGGN